jgi:hypothetical protein
MLVRSPLRIQLLGLARYCQEYPSVNLTYDNRPEGAWLVEFEVPFTVDPTEQEREIVGDQKNDMHYVRWKVRNYGIDHWKELICGNG